MNSKRLNSCDLKKHNKANVFKYIYAHGRCTKQDIAYGLHLSLPTVTACLTDLSLEGLCENDGTASSTGGRKAQYVNINKDYRVFIGIAITRKHQRIIAVDLVGNKIAYKMYRNERDISPEKLSVSLHDNLEEFITESKIKREDIYCTNIAIPGIFKDDGVIRLAPTLGYKNVPFSEISKNLPYNCNAINDADAGGFSEWWNNGDDKPTRNIIYLSLDKGIGGSICLDSIKYDGDNNHSAEFGHMCVNPGGKKCGCGRSGCLEAYCSISVLSDDLNCTIEEFFDKIEQNNEEYKKILDSYLDNLAIAVTNINTVFDAPIVIGGTLSRFADKFSDDLSEKLSKTIIFNDEAEIFTISKYRDIASCYGAALLGINDIFKSFV